MKFYDPLKVVDRTGSISLVISIVLVILFLLTAFGIGLIIYPAISLKIIVALVVSRVVYAVIKGD